MYVFLDSKGLTSTSKGGEPLTVKSSSGVVIVCSSSTECLYLGGPKNKGSVEHQRFLLPRGSPHTLLVYGEGSSLRPSFFTTGPKFEIEAEPPLVEVELVLAAAPGVVAFAAAFGRQVIGNPSPLGSLACPPSSLVVAVYHPW